MPGSTLEKMRAGWRLLQGIFAPAPQPISQFPLPAAFHTSTRAQSPRIPWRVSHYPVEIQDTIQTLVYANEWEPRLRNLSTVLENRLIVNGLLKAQPLMIQSWNASAFLPVIWPHHGLGSEPPRTTTILAFSVAENFRGPTKTYWAPPVAFDPRASKLMRIPNYVFHMESVACQSFTWPEKAIIRRGTSLSQRWRVRRSSLDVNRLPQSSWDGYFNEVLVQKQIPAGDIELVGVYLVPSAGIEELTIDVGRHKLYFYFAKAIDHRAVAHTLIVARDKTKGAILTVVDGRDRRRVGGRA